MRVIGPRRLNIGGILVRLGYSPEWRWVKRPKRGGFGSVVELVGIGVMLGTPRGAEETLIGLCWSGFLVSASFVFVGRPARVIRFLIQQK
jgi:hypothetical protein